ncbi:MAG: hypothetical protein QNK23_00935 [Crocinitomicaceae bacterium]|nr:hypothetical protein [Crocinitomicaceae bacterium]
MGLFDERTIGDYLKIVSTRIKSELNGLTDNRILENDASDLAGLITNKYWVSVPKVDFESKKDVSVINRTIPSARGMSGRANIQIAVYKLPFSDGDANVLKCIPTAYSMNPPIGKIYDNYLKVEVPFYGIIDNNPKAKEQVNSDALAIVEKIKTNCQNLDKDCKKYMSEIRTQLEALINQRKQELNIRKGTEDDLSF